MDAVSAVTGIWQKAPDARLNVALVLPQAMPPPERTRAAMVAANPLMLALGRPNREQVVTTRAAAATTLQTLELLNGPDAGEPSSTWRRAAARQREGAPERLSTRCSSARSDATPTKAERMLSTEALGARPDQAAIEDLLWSVVMLPEFQVVR